MCFDTHFGEPCVDRDNVCDGYNDCQDGSDEVRCFHGGQDRIAVSQL